MKTKFDVLPDWTFVGGVTQEYEFTLQTEDGGFYDVPGGTASLAIAPFVNVNNTVLTKPGVMTTNAEGVACVAVFTLDPSETVDLKGKYIYQISVKSAEGSLASPLRGRMFIANNIDKAFV